MGRCEGACSDSCLSGCYYALSASGPTEVKRSQIGGAMLLFLLSAGVFTRLTYRTGVSPPRNPAHSPVEIHALALHPFIESVDLKNGNVDVEIPIRAAPVIAMIVSRSRW